MKLFFTAIVAIAVVSSTNAALEETKVADVPVFLEKKPTLRIKGASPPLTVQCKEVLLLRKKLQLLRTQRRKLLLRKLRGTFDLNLNAGSNVVVG
jgi:hypothetical protein